MTILDQLAGHARERVAADQERRSPLEELQSAGLALPQGRLCAFETALRKAGALFYLRVQEGLALQGAHRPGVSPICKLHGTMRRRVRTAISVLTEPKWFLGSDRHLQEIARTAVASPACGRTLRWTNT